MCRKSTVLFVLFTALTATSLTVTVKAKTVPNNVTISRCCAVNESVKSDEHFTCAPDFHNPWSPKIYSPSKRTYLKSVPKRWHIVESRKPTCRYAQPTYFRGASTQSFIMFENGSLLLLLEYSEKLVHPNSYCIDAKAALVCLDDVRAPEKQGARVKKCCGESAVYSDTNRTCMGIKGSDYRIDLDGDKVLVDGFVSCENDTQLVIAGKIHEIGSILDNGSFLLEGTNTLLPNGAYCLEHVLENAGPSASVFTCHNLLSTPGSASTGRDVRFILYPVGLALSAIFLAATLAAGSLLPASHHVLHWRCQTNHVACLLLGDILLCITQLSGHSLSHHHFPCAAIAVSMHFLFLAAFFWLNTMCFNIWWTFRDLRPASLEKGQERCRLRLYEIYAWGVPLFIAGIAALLDSLPDNPDYAFLRPRFGTNNCWFHGDVEILTYFYGPVGVLLITNLALFAATARELTCGLWKRELVKSTTERAALGRVCMKLVVVMGVTWIADVLSWAVGGPQELWYLTDLINCLQGVFIFIVVGCQPQVLTAVKRIWCLRQHSSTGTSGHGNHHSSSSQALPSLGDTVTNHSVTNNTKSAALETTC